MKVPLSDRNKALIIVDVQVGFLNDRNGYIVQNIESLIKNYEYNFFVESVFHAEKGSLWDKQTGWVLPKDANFCTVKEITDLIQNKDCLHIEKTTKSVFKGNQNLFKELRERNIEEIHIVGLDSNDCVLATAYEAFDLGFYTYVIEECVESSDSEKMRDIGFEVLRHVNLTNNSCVEDIKFAQIT